MKEERLQLQGPVIATMDITYKCTLRCLHCFNFSGEHTGGKQEMTDEELIKVSHQIAELSPNVICLCGGEPLLRKEIVYECCKIITQGSNNMTQVNMVTNGELLTEEVAKDIKKAGLSLVQVSIDGASAETHDWLRNRDGAFDKAIIAIKNLKEAGLVVGVACTPTLRNINEIEEIIALCENLGVDSFRMQPLMPLGRAKKNLQDKIPTYRDYKKVANLLNKLKLIHSSQGRMAIEWGDPVDHLIRFRRKLAGRNVSLGISAYGGVTISPYLPITLGNIRKHSLVDYWKNGMTNAWEIPIVQHFSKQSLSCENLGISSHIDDSTELEFFDKDIDIDIIDQDVFNIQVKDIKQYI